MDLLIGDQRDRIMQAGMNVFQFEVRIIIGKDLIEGKAFAYQLQNALNGNAPVSYTHLDVYKRQLLELRGRYTLVIVTHNIAQARRLADYVMFMWLGELVEHLSLIHI